jgi:hypothetical protein
MNRGHLSKEMTVHCGVFIDLCACRLWQPLPDGRMELLGDANPRVVAALLEPLRPRLEARAAPDLLTFADAASRVGLKAKTLYEWKRTGKLRREHGLRAVGRNVRIEWPVFKAYVDSGELS